MNTNKEYIAMSAIYIDDKKVYDFQKAYGVNSGIVFCGYRHPYIYIPKSFQKYDKIYGFITNYGRFVNRKEACNIAIECGQVEKEFVQTGELFSEDIFKFQLNSAI